VAWRFGSAVGNDVGRINEVNRRRARLVLGWVTDRRQAGKPACNQPPRSTQPGHSSVDRRNEHRRKLGRKQTHCAMH